MIKSEKKRPRHQANEIRSLFKAEFCGWSIYPDQLPFMRLHLAAELERIMAPRRRCTRIELARQADSILRTLGLVPPAEQSKIKNQKSKIR